MQKKLSRAQRQALEEFSQSHPNPIRRRVAKVLLLYDSGLATRVVSVQAGISPSRARYWKRQFNSNGMMLFTKGKILGKDIGQETNSAPQMLGTDDVEHEQAVAITSPIIDDLSIIESRLNELTLLQGSGVAADDLLGEAGRKVLRFHFGQMLLHEPGTIKGEDIEELHHMRVATRRMRAAIDIFGDYYQPKVIKPYLKGLRAIGRALGNVRDLDVFIDKAQVYARSHENSGASDLSPLITAWQEQRDQNRRKMINYLNGENYRSFKNSFLSFVNKPGKGIARKPATESLSNQVRNVAPVLIYNRLGIVRTFDSLIDNATVEQLHTLRIEFKRLRYTLEFFREVLGEQIKEVIGEIKKIQDHLGDLNDAQVATVMLRNFLAVWDAQQEKLPMSERRNPEPLIIYLTEKYQERHRLLMTFAQVWVGFNRLEFRQKIASAVSVL